MRHTHAHTQSCSCCIRQVLAFPKAGVRDSKALVCQRKHVCTRQLAIKVTSKCTVRAFRTLLCQRKHCWIRQGPVTSCCYSWRARFEGHLSANASTSASVKGQQLLKLACVIPGALLCQRKHCCIRQGPAAAKVGVRDSRGTCLPTRARLHPSACS